MDHREELRELVADLRVYLEDQLATAAGAPESPPPRLDPPPPPADAAPGARSGPRGDAAGGEPGAPASGARGAPQGPPRPAGETLDAVRADLGDCARCKLAETRTRLVFGDGSPSADLVFVGEAPGRDEDRRGIPFVGAAGQMLTRMITNVLRLERSEVYICNVLKCRPPGNRNPQPDEIAACTPFLDRQIEAIAPRLIVALGRPAARHLLDTDAPVGSLRGRLHRRGSVPVIVTYHPAYLLRSPHEKPKAMDDLMRIREHLQRSTGRDLPPPLSARDVRRR